jgi:hypothetical protein
MGEERLTLEKRLFSLFVLLVLVGAVVVAWDWTLRASIIVLVLGGIGIVLALFQTIAEFRPARAPKASGGMTFDTPQAVVSGRWGNLEIWAWILGFYAAIHLIGFLAAAPLFVFSYSKIYGARWPVSLGLTLLSWGFAYAIFERVMHVPWPKAILLELFFS